MIKLLLCLTAVTCFSLLNVATADCLGFALNKWYGKALPECQTECSSNDGLACYHLGQFYDKGLGVRQDTQKAKSYYEKACNLNEGTGCYTLGVIYKHGFNGVREDMKKAKEYFGKTCDLGEQQGCDAYRRLNERGY